MTGPGRDLLCKPREAESKPGGRFTKQAGQIQDYFDFADQTKPKSLRHQVAQAVEGETQEQKLKVCLSQKQTKNKRNKR